MSKDKIPNLHADEEERLKKLFDSLDKNKDGSISVKELGEALKGPEHKRLHHAEKVIGKDSTMGFNEFVEYVLDHETHLKLAFKQLDRNQDNVVDAHEIQLAMKDLGVTIPLAEAEKLLRKMDKDGSLSIDYEEWRDFLIFSGMKDIQSILKYWRKSASFDIGENVSVPDDFTDQERKTGVVWKTLVSGGVAGAVSRTSTAPLDRLKVMWQAHGGKAAQGGMSSAIQNMIKEGGIQSMWRGNGVNVIKIAPESAIKFVAYEHYKKIILGNAERDVNLMEKFCAGALAGATAQTLIYPMEVLKTRMCLRKTGQYNNLFDCARKVYAEGGMTVFYRGYVPNILGILPYAGIDLALYETFKNMYMSFKGSEGECPPLYVSLTAGAVSSVCGQVATYPLALVRTKLQAKPKSEGKSSMLTLFSNIWKHEGIPGLYRGLGPNMLKVIPAVSISYAVFEKVKHYLGVD